MRAELRQQPVGAATDHGGLRALGLKALDAAIVAWLFLGSGALFPLLLSEPGSVELSDGAKAALRLLVLPSFALAGLLAALRPRPLLGLLLRHPLLPLLLLWACCSLAWSLDPDLSLRRATALLTFTVIAAGLVLAYEPAALLRRVALVLLGKLLLSLAFAAALPSLAFMPDDHLLRGIFLHKNVLGQVLVFAAILLLAGWPFRLIPRGLALLGLALLPALALMAGSATALVLILLVGAVQLLPALLALPPRQAAAILLLGVSAGTFAALAGILLLDEILALLGRDLTLTGRTQLWAYALNMIGHRPLTGYGYAVFFDLPSIARYLEEALRWKIPNAHSGYLEVALGLGLPGLALAALLLASGIGRSLRLLAAARRTDPQAALAASFAFFYLLAYALRNLVESDLVSQGQLSWVLAVVAFLLPSAAGARGTAPAPLIPGDLWRR